MTERSERIIMKIRGVVIRMRVKRWILPVVCFLPYVVSLVWMLTQGLVWIFQIMLAPLIMGTVLGIMTFILAEVEFRGSLARVKGGMLEWGRKATQSWKRALKHFGI